MTTTHLYYTAQSKHVFVHRPSLGAISKKPSKSYVTHQQQKRRLQRKKRETWVPLNIEKYEIKLDKNDHRHVLIIPSPILWSFSFFFLFLFPLLFHSSCRHCSLFHYSASIHSIESIAESNRMKNVRRNCVPFCSLIVNNVICFA